MRNMICKFFSCKSIQQICLLEQKYNLDYDVASTFKECHYSREMRTRGQVSINDRMQVL